MVPQKFSEEEFWTQFFQSQFFHRESKSQQFVDCLSGDQQEGLCMCEYGGLGDNDVIGLTRLHQISVPETSSELLGEEVGYCKTKTYQSIVRTPQGYSVSSECTTAATSSSLLKRCNHHSNRVLEALMEGIAAPDDTHTSPSQSHSHLQLKRAADTESSVTSSDSLLYVAESLSSWQLHQVCTFLRYSAPTHSC